MSPWNYLTKTNGNNEHDPAKSANKYDQKKQGIKIVQFFLQVSSFYHFCSKQPTNSFVLFYAP